MTNLTKSLPLILLLALAAPANAQTTDEETATTEDAEPADALALSMGEQDVAVGDVYISAKHGDWEIRCIKSENGNDPCQLYQLLNAVSESGEKSPVAEINIFAIGGEEGPTAGATIITPLETLLTQQLSMSVDGGKVKKYPFSWCSQIGCFSRVGFSEGDISAFKRGVNATLSIVPVAAADQRVSLTVSLKGFTAGYTDLQERLSQ